MTGKARSAGVIAGGNRTPLEGDTRVVVAGEEAVAGSCSSATRREEFAIKKDQPRLNAAVVVDLSSSSARRPSPSSSPYVVPPE